MRKYVRKHENVTRTFLLFGFLFFINISSVFSQVDYPNSVQVNTTIDGDQDSPEIAVNGAGTVLTVFESEANGPDETIFAVSYDRKNFREFYTTGPTTDTASLEAFPDNESFVITWAQNGEIFFAIVSCKDGQETFIVEPSPVRQGIKSYGGRPDLAISQDGSLFVIGWHINDVVMQFYDSSGYPLGDLIYVAGFLPYKQEQLSLKFWPDSSLAATWHSETAGVFETQSRDEDIWFQLFDCKPVWSDNAPEPFFEAPKRANGDLSSTDPVWYNQEYPEVDVFNDGRFVIMWQDFPYSSAGGGSDGNDKGAYFRIFNHDGTPQTDDIQLSEHTTSFQKDADIRIRQSDKTIHFIYEDAYESTLEKNWLAYPSYRVFDDMGNALDASFELSNKSYGTDCRLAITEADAENPNLVLFIWETKDIENVDGSGRSVIFRDLTTETFVNHTALDFSFPEQFQLFQNYPNPFNSETRISYVLHKDSHVQLDLYNSLGQKVLALVDREQQAGQYYVHMDASELVSGIYIARLTFESQTRSIKLMYLK